MQREGRAPTGFLEEGSAPSPPPSPERQWWAASLPVVRAAAGASSKGHILLNGDVFNPVYAVHLRSWPAARVHAGSPEVRDSQKGPIWRKQLRN